MELREVAWVVDARPGGWVRLREADGPSAYLQFRQAGPTGQERFDMQAVVLKASSDEALSARTWRRIPFSEVERFLTIPRVRVALTFPCKEPPPAVLEELDAYFEAGEFPGNPSETGYISSGMLVSDEPEHARAGKVPAVKAPEGRLTDDFLQDVATAYRWFTDSNRAPAPGISELSGVPVRTVHRWIYEARKRGILPPARPGRAG